MSSARLSQLDQAQDFWATLAERAAWDVPTAARLMQVSVRQLERLCQRDLGSTPTDWFQARRMTRAAELLTAGQTIKQAAAHLGYTQPANFSRDFKHHHGRTPRTFAPRPLFGLPALPGSAAPSPTGQPMPK
jgi:AraC-like DNA-binding protein